MPLQLSEQPNPQLLTNVVAVLCLRLCLCLALPLVCVMQFVTLWSRRRGLGPYVQFTDSSESLDPNWHPEQIEIMDRQTNFKVGVGWCRVDSSLARCNIMVDWNWMR